MSRFTGSWQLGLIVAIGMACSGLAQAHDPRSVRITPGESWQAVGDGRLDAVRGGFDIGSGLLASFGIDRQIFVNGQLVASSVVDIPDVARITPQQADTLAAVANTVTMVQVGMGNTADPATVGQLSTVIQNTLDHQDIRSLTTLNISVNNLSAFRGLNLQDALQSSLVNSRGP
jgi:hypothetical protein